MLDCDLCASSIGSLDDPIYVNEAGSVVCRDCVRRTDGSIPDSCDYDPDDVADVRVFVSSDEDAEMIESALRLDLELLGIKGQVVVVKRGQYPEMTAKWRLVRE